MNVYVVIHDDRHYDMGDSYLRGIFLTEDAAKASVVTRTPSGRKSKAWDAHDDWCCGVEEREVLDAPDVEVKEDPPPTAPDALTLISKEVMDEIVRNALKESPFTRQRP